jgi:hypothetical protein
MRRLRPELKGYESQTLECHECLQPTLVVGGAMGKCGFCEQTWTAHELMTLCVGRERGPLIREICPQCSTGTLASNIYVASHPATEVFFCFTCATTFSDLFPCDRCGQMLAPGDTAGGEALCGTCWEFEDSGVSAESLPDLFECARCGHMLIPSDADDEAEAICASCAKR